MNVQDFPQFLAASVLLMFIPGVDMALVTRQVVVHGRRAAFATLGGLLLGGLAHAAFAAVGLSALLLASAGAYAAVKLVGAAYLIALGIQTVWASWRRPHDAVDRHASKRPPQPHDRMSLKRAFLVGFVSDVTNPKVALFFVTFLPQFVTPRHDAVSQLAFLGILFNVIATSWWIGYVLLLDRVSGLLRRSAVRRVLENVTGLVLVALGLRVATERR